MRKRGLFVILFLFVSMFLMSFTLADAENSSQLCTDSDGGVIFDKKGTTRGLDYYVPNIMKVFTDECFSANMGGVDDDNWLLEGYCKDGYVFTTDYLCPYDCFDGACVEAPLANATCTDSDGGEEFYIFGATTGLYFPDNSTIVLKDKCFSVGGANSNKEYNWLLEGYCDGVYAYTTDYQCPYECLDGVCVDEDLEYCTDSDGGKKYYIRGITVGLHNGDPSWEFIDKCINNEWVLEGYCDGIPAYTKSYQCPYGCENGACLTTTGGDPGGDINLTGGNTLNDESFFVKENWLAFVLIGLIVITLVLFLVFVNKKKK